MDAKSKPGPLVSVRHAAHVGTHPLAAAPIPLYAVKLPSFDTYHPLLANAEPLRAEVYQEIVVCCGYVLLHTGIRPQPVVQ